MFINIELKVPINEQAKRMYRYQDCARIVHELVHTHDMIDNVLVSSFDRDILREIENHNLRMHNDS